MRTGFDSKLFELLLHLNVREPWNFCLHTFCELLFLLLNSLLQLLLKSQTFWKVRQFGLSNFLLAFQFDALITILLFVFRATVHNLLLAFCI